MGLRVKEEGASEGRPVRGRLGVATSPPAQAGRLPSGVGVRAATAHRQRKRRRQVGEVARTALVRLPPPSAYR
jgi:hypothetical protein